MRKSCLNFTFWKFLEHSEGVQIYLFWQIQVASGRSNSIFCVIGNTRFFRSRGIVVWHIWRWFYYNWKLREKEQKKDLFFATMKSLEPFQTAKESNRYLRSRLRLQIWKDIKLQDILCRCDYVTSVGSDTRKPENPNFWNETR